MPLIQFTRNYHDHSTDKGFQFEFFCDRCGNGFMSEFKTSGTGMAVSALHAAGGFFGGVLGRAAGNTWDIERTVLGPAHDKAFREAIEESKVNFKQCPKCSHWVCINTCWNAKRSLCFECGKPLRPKNECSKCGTKFEAGTKFCPECGNKIV